MIKQIEAYEPYNEQEARDKEIILSMLTETERMGEDIFSRENRMAHMTASAWVVNRDRTKVLLAYHNIYNSWAWLGGHADGERNLLSVAVREVCEESGLTPAHVRPAWLISQKGDLSQGSAGDIFSLEVLAVGGHFKKGEYISSHLHLNVTYLLESDEEETLYKKEDENSSVKWFLPEEALAASSELWFAEHIYRKLNEKAGL